MLRHPADGFQWTNIDREFLDLDKDARNLKFGLITDRMNPSKKKEKPPPPKPKKNPPKKASGPHLLRRRRSQLRRKRSLHLRS
jgi:hypothetical protein